MSDQEDLDDLIGLTENEARAMAALKGSPWIDYLYQTNRGWQEHAGHHPQRLTLKINSDGIVEDAFWG